MNNDPLGFMVTSGRSRCRVLRSVHLRWAKALIVGFIFISHTLTLLMPDPTLAHAARVERRGAMVGTASNGGAAFVLDRADLPRYIVERPASYRRLQADARMNAAAWNGERPPWDRPWEGGTSTIKPEAPPRLPNEVIIIFDPETGELSITTDGDLNVGCTGEGGFLRVNGFDQVYACGDISAIQVNSDYPVDAPGITINLGQVSAQYFTSLTDGVTIQGGAGDDTIFGSQFDDRVDAVNGSNRIIGNNGNDLLIGGSGNDLIDAGDGDDTLVGGGGDDTLWAGEGIDWLIGETTDEDVQFDIVLTDDSIEYSGGINASGTISDFEIAWLVGNTFPNHFDAAAFSGNVIMEGIGGDNILIGGDGHDILLGSLGYDTLIGNGGHDILIGNDGYDHLDGGAGDDLVMGGGNDDILIGGAGQDTLDGGDGYDILIAEGRGFTLSDEELIEYTGPGQTEPVSNRISNIQHAIISGDENNNLIDASLFSGSVHLDGREGNDTLIGTDQDDYLTVSSSSYTDRNLFIAGQGNDTILGGLGADTMWGGEGNDRLIVPANNTVGSLMYGDDGDDVLLGGSGRDSLFGGGGHDTLRGGGGHNYLNGESGNDHLHLGTGDDTAYGGEGDDLITADGGNNLIHGDAGDDTLTGGTGNDTIYGGAGNDSITGGGGNDVLYGNAGNDTLVSGMGTDFMFGNEGTDLLIVDGPGTKFLDGGEDDDLYHLHSTGSNTVYLQESAGKGANDEAHFFAANQPGYFRIDNNRMTQAGNRILFNRELEHLHIHGGAQDDIFEVNPAENTTYHLDGGAHITGDELIVRVRSSAGVIEEPDRILVPGYKPIHYSNIEKITYVEGMRLYIPLVRR